MTGSTQTLESGERTGKAPQAGCLLGNTDKSRGNYILAKQVLCGIRKAPGRVSQSGWQQGKAFPRQTPSRGHLKISRGRLAGRCGETGLWGIPGARAGETAPPPLETESGQVWLEFRRVRQKLPHRGSRGREPGMAFSFKSLKALLGSPQPSPGTAYKQAGMAV